MNRIILIDGNPLMWRAVYAQSENFVTEGILIYFFDILDKFDCDRVLALWDSGKSRWRTTMYPEYKASREARKKEINLEEMGIQKKEAKRILSYYGVRNITVPGVEADDMIAWFAEYFSIDHKVLIASRDKDLWQLISDRVTIFDPLSNTLVQTEDVHNELGISPALIPDWKALVGDPSDNIKGVKGVGNKTALKLIDDFGDISSLLDPENSKELKKKKTTAKVINSSGDLEHSYQLVKLPSLEDMNYFMNEREISVFREELEKPLDTDPLKGQVELDLLGRSRIRCRFVDSLKESLPQFIERLEKPSLGFSEYVGIEQCLTDLSVCNRCSLRHPSKRREPKGPCNANIMVVGRGVTEKGIRSELVEDLYEQISIKESACWVTDVCKCPSGYRPLLYSAIEACSKFLKAEIRLVAPKLIISLGVDAMSSITPHKYRVMRHVGEIEKRVIGDYSCFVAILPDPIDLLRNEGKKQDWNYGVSKIKEFLDARRKK